MAVPLVVRHILENKAPITLKRNVAVERVRFNPFTLTARLYGLSVGARDDGKPFVDVQDLTVNLQAVSLFKGALVIKQLLVVQPRLHIQRVTANRFNFSDLIPAPAPSPEPAAKPMRLVLSSLVVANGRVVFQDQAAAEPFETTLSEIALTLGGLDTQPQAPPAAFDVALQADSGAALAVSGSLSPSPLDVQADLELKNLTIDTYRAYYKTYLNETAIKQGRVDLKARLKWSDKAQTVENGELTVADLAVQRSVEPAPMVSVGRLAVAGVHVDLPGRTIQVNHIETSQGRIQVIRDKQGGLNLLQALALDTGGEGKPAPSGNAVPAWRIDLSEANLGTYAVGFSDQYPAQPATLALDAVSLSVKDLSTRPEHPAQLSFEAAWGDKGKMAVQGNLAVVPLKAELAITAENLDIRPLQPYLSEQMRLLVTSGFAGTTGTLKIAASQQAPAAISYRGKASLTEFKSVDADKVGDFLAFNSLYINDLALDTAPLSITVNEVALTDFYNRLIIDGKGTSNIALITGKARAEEQPRTDQPTDGKPDPQAETQSGQAPEKPAPEKAPPAPAAVSVKTVTLQGGKVDFTDLSIKPTVHLPMTQISGRVSGLDTIQENKADVFLKGKINDNVPMEITGQVNPLIAKPFVDLKLSVVGIDLSPFTPYSGKYLGHTLERGQLSMDLKYLLADNRLQADNKIVLNQLTLGNTVASPSATKLPVKLAIALLKDRQGNIDIDLPVSGNIDDPEFSLGGIIGKMLVNLIVSIVTSPFKMLGALFGGGEELAFMDFDPGSADITPENSGKLDTLAKILYERPNLKLEIQGRINTEGDTDGLRRLRFERSSKQPSSKTWLRPAARQSPLTKWPSANKSVRN